MTLVVSWTRTTNRGRELWMISDSRLGGGKCWDYGPKIFGIGRSDAVIAFAGHTDWSYPLIAQITSYVESFINLRERAIDLVKAYSVILELLNDALTFVSDPAHPSVEVPECTFLFAGYSAVRKDFLLRRIVFNRGSSRFEDRPPRIVGGEYLAYIGDAQPMGAFARGLYEPRENKDSRARLDMGPAKAFFSVLSSGACTEVGGAPQLAKVYQHGGQRHFGVYWPPDVPTDKQRIYLRGRRLGRFEILDHPWVYEPSSSKLFWHDFSPDERRALGAADNAAV